MTRTFPVDDPSRVAEIRRAATAMAHGEKLSETLAGHVSIVVTEICTNLLKHAQSGEVFLSTLSDRYEKSLDSGVEILAIDRGPGMVDLARCLVDGYSSVESSGTGLGALTRLATELDIHSEQLKGTVLVARVKPPGAPRTVLGLVLQPIAGEEVSGDAWAFYRGHEGTALIVADGLGHGPSASAAAQAAIQVFRSRHEFSPTGVLRQVHEALRSTRGAAVAIAYLPSAAGPMRYAGVGNISAVLAGASKSQQMVSHNGTAGYQLPRLQEFTYVLPAEPLLIMHSDGLHTNWKAEALRGRDPSVIAGVLYRDYSRRRDDTCVVVARLGGKA